VAEASRDPLLAPCERRAVEAFLAQVRRILGPELREVRLFGSHARGDAHPDSDLDLALLVTAQGRARRYQIYDLAFDLGLEHGVELAPLVIEETLFYHLRARERRIAMDIEREGIPL
jgi:hypothetical protein